MRRAAPVAFNRVDTTAEGDPGERYLRLSPGDAPYRRSLRLRRPDLVPRDRLLGAFTAAARDVPLLQLVAPAGYGKTTALRQWAARSGRPCARIELTIADNDPAHLVHHILLAVSRIQPTVLHCRFDRSTDAP